MSECEHKENTVCDETCHCTCESCQQHFEVAWAKRVAEKDLCELCGMPMDMTLEKVMEEHATHFFQPCDICRPAFLLLMQQNRMCPTCQQYVKEDQPCDDCFCTEQPYSCVCRQCKAYRKSLERE